MRPDGWRKGTLRDLADVVGGFAFPHSAQGRRGLPFPFFKVSDMNRRGNEVWLADSENWVDEALIHSLKARLYPRGTVVFPKVGAALLTNKRRLLAGPAVFDNNVMGLVPRDADCGFLFHLMQTIDFNSMVQPGAVPSINGTMVSAIGVLTPPIGERRKIATILSSVDDTIEVTQAVIDQLQIVKKAVTAELLTRGMPGRHHRYVPLIGDWRLGRVRGGVLEIPESWELVRLSTVARLESGHTPSRRHPEYWNGDIPWVSLHDSKNLDGPEIFDTVQTIGPLGLANSSARLLPKGTVVFSRTATVGKACITGREMATSQDFANYVCGDRLHNRYLLHLFRHMEDEWRRLMAGSTHKTVYMPIFRDLQVLLPVLGEQQEIAAVADALDARLEAEQGVLAGLRRVKSALMSVLLTGEIRVTPNQDEVAA
jgi:type I restriction enzyme S subunit